jgi:hypothetical protein
MARTRLPLIERSKYQALRLIPLYAHGVPAAAGPKSAANPPAGPVLISDMEQHVRELIARYPDPPAYTSAAKIKRLIKELELRVPARRLPKLTKAINAAVLEYTLRLGEEAIPLSRWLPRYQRILALFRKLGRLLPERDDLLFNIVCHFGESYAASKGPHPGLLPYELEHVLDNFPFPVNYRSNERLQQVTAGIREITAWMQSHLDARVGDLEQFPLQDLSAAVWLTGYELPRIYELFFGKRFSASLSANKAGPGIRFVMHILDAVEVRAASGRKFSPQTLRTYRRRARKAMSRV